MDEKYRQAISSYNLRELNKSLQQWDDKCLAEILSIDIMQDRLLKSIINNSTNKEN